MRTIQTPHLLTKLEIWAPRYSSQYTDISERVALVADYKLRKATPLVLIEFTKAKHLEGQRFSILRDEALRFPVHQVKSKQGNMVDMRVIPESAFDGWQTQAEAMQAQEIDI